MCHVQIMHLKILITIVVFSFGCLVSAEPLSFSQRALTAKAVRYERALGVKRDYRKAFRLYCLAAIQGDKSAVYSIGWLYFNGRGVPRDLELAVGWFQKAATLGSQYGETISKRFPSISPKLDKSCPIFVPGMPVSKQHVETWVRLIAPEFSIDPDLVLHVIGTESAFNYAALSTKNAHGLMQLIPATAKRFGVKDIWNPVQNITGGVAYLNWLMRHFNGNVRFVLAAYNAGESAVRRYKGIPPYGETQRYVRKIIGNYHKTVHPVPAA